MDLKRLAKDKRINCLCKVGCNVMPLRLLLNKQLDGVKRVISASADTSEYHCVDENITNLFSITPHLCSLQTLQRKAKTPTPQTHHFSLCRAVFVSKHYAQRITYFLVHNFLATFLIKYSV